MKKESFWLKLMLRSYGIKKKLNKDELQEVQRIGNNCNFVLSNLEIFYLLVAIFLGYKKGFWFLLLVNFLSVIGINIYSTHAMDQQNLLDNEITLQERPKAIVEIVFKDILWGIFTFFLVLYCIFASSGYKGNFGDNWFESLIALLFRWCHF